MIHKFLEYGCTLFAALPPSQHSVIYRTTVTTITFFHNENLYFPWLQSLNVKIVFPNCKPMWSWEQVQTIKNHLKVPSQMIFELHKS
jgi:hypothetical protein